MPEHVPQILKERMGGIFVQESMDHYVRISRAYRGGQRQTIWFTYEKNGKPVKDTAVRCSLEKALLRLLQAEQDLVEMLLNWQPSVYTWRLPCGAFCLWCKRKQQWSQLYNVVIDLSGMRSCIFEH